LIPAASALVKFSIIYYYFSPLFVYFPELDLCKTTYPWLKFLADSIPWLVALVVDDPFVSSCFKFDKLWGSS